MMTPHTDGEPPAETVRGHLAGPGDAAGEFLDMILRQGRVERREGYVRAMVYAVAQLPLGAVVATWMASHSAELAPRFVIILVAIAVPVMCVLASTGPSRATRARHVAERRTFLSQLEPADLDALRSALAPTPPITARLRQHLSAGPRGRRT